MEITKKQAVLCGIAAAVVLLGAVLAGGIFGGLVGYGIGQERGPWFHERVVYTDTAPLTGDGPIEEIDEIREWIGALEHRIALLELRADDVPGSMGIDQLFPLLLMMLGTLFDGGGWYGMGADPGYPE